MEKSTLVNTLLAWYEDHKRPLPWREDRDPYKIWLSEVILQQTRVVQGLPYYQRFVAAYPTVHDLAAASEQDVLHLWQGLGYYRRARHLHQCSQHVVQHLGGRFPRTYKALLQLPGIGPYTAAAIASIAFDESVAVVDGNVYRVLARLLGRDEDIASPLGQKTFRTLADTYVPTHHAGTYNQALMEFGALHCTPQQPQCATCPFQNVCVAYQTQQQHRLPVKVRRVQIKHRYLHYLIIHAGDDVYVKQRTTQDIWQGLYDFYLIENTSSVAQLDQLDDPIVPHIQAHQLTTHLAGPPLQHQLTHQRLHIRFFDVHATKAFLHATADLLHTRTMIPYDRHQLDQLPFPRAIHRFFETQTQPMLPLSTTPTSPHPDQGPF